MSFKLRVLLEGIYVLFPDKDKQSTEIVLVHTGDEDPNAHTCQLTVRRGNVVSSRGQLPVTLWKTDVYLYDGVNLMEDALGGSHSFDSIPKLRHALKDFETLPGVRRADLPTMSDSVNGRLLLTDGQFSELHLTAEKYEMYDKIGKSRVGPDAEKVFQCLMYERVITSTSVAIRSSFNNAPAWSFDCEPVGGFVEVVIGNYSHHETRRNPDIVTDAPHFSYVFELFKTKPKKNVGLREKGSRKKKWRNRGLRVPCIGGCTC